MGGPSPVTPYWDARSMFDRTDGQGVFNDLSPTCVLRGVKADADRAQATGVPVRGQSVLGLPFAVTCRRLRVTWPSKASH